MHEHERKAILVLAATMATKASKLPKSGTCGGNILPFPVHHATTVLL